MYDIGSVVLVGITSICMGLVILIALVANVVMRGH